MSAKRITKSRKRRLCEHLRTHYENTPGKVAAMSEDDFQKASHKSSKIVENSPADTTRVPDTHFYVRGGPEEATPLRKSMKIDDTLRKSTDIDGNLRKYCFPVLRRILNSGLHLMLTLVHYSSTRGGRGKLRGYGF